MTIHLRSRTGRDVHRGRQHLHHARRRHRHRRPHRPGGLRALAGLGRATAARPRRHRRDLVRAGRRRPLHDGPREFVPRPVVGDRPPRHAAHLRQRRPDAPATLFCTVSPADYVDYFRAAGDPAADARGPVRPRRHAGADARFDVHPLLEEQRDEDDQDRPLDVAGALRLHPGLARGRRHRPGVRGRPGPDVPGRRDSSAPATSRPRPARRSSICGPSSTPPALPGAPSSSSPRT